MSSSLQFLNCKIILKNSKREKLVYILIIKTAKGKIKIKENDFKKNRKFDY